MSTDPRTTDYSPDAYAAGDVTDLEALRALTINLAEVESDIEPLEAERKALRGQIEPIVQRLGGKATAAGYAHSITAPGETVSYDAKALDALTAWLLSSGYPDIAERVAAARKTSTRAGSLRISKERSK